MRLGYHDNISPWHPISANQLRENLRWETLPELETLAKMETSGETSHQSHDNVSKLGNFLIQDVTVQY